jgi:hypothetical protein
MKRSDVYAIVGVAVVTMAVTLGILAPRPLTAEAENTIKPMIAVPELSVEDCVLTVSTDKTEYLPGDRPQLVLRATNKGSAALSTTISLSITATSPASMLSRRLEIPEPLWTHQQLVTLQPGETRTYTLDTDAELPAGQMISIAISAGDQGMVIPGLQLLQASAAGE